MITKKWNKMDITEKEYYEKTISEQNKKIADLEKTISTLIYLHKYLQTKHDNEKNNLSFPATINLPSMINKENKEIKYTISYPILELNENVKYTPATSDPVHITYSYPKPNESSSLIPSC